MTAVRTDGDHYTALLEKYPDRPSYLWRHSPTAARFFQQLRAWSGNAVMGRRHVPVSEAELRSRRTSDTVFVFGSGYSINAIAAEEWAHFASHNTFSFNWFAYQSLVRIDFHLIRETYPIKSTCTLHRITDHYCANILRNPLYENAILFAQSGWKAIGANMVLTRMATSRRVYRYRNRAHGVFEPPSPSFENGIVHGPASLVDCINVAVILGWTKIVLVGIDLYDRRYFWLDREQTSAGDTLRGATHDEPHSTANRVVAYLAQWREFLDPRGVQLFVYNPRSLLAQVIPVYTTALRAAL